MGDELDTNAGGTQGVALTSGVQPINVTSQPGQAGPTSGYEGTPGVTPAPATTPPPAMPAAATPPATQPAVPTPTQGAPHGSTTAVPAAPAAAGPATGGGQAGDGWQGIRDAARSYGVDLSSFPDDMAALQHLLAQATQSGQYAAAAQRYLQHAGPFEQWLQQQAQATQQAQQQQQRPFGQAPEFNPSWEQLITRDAQGNATGVVPGADPSILPRYLAYRQYRRDFADRLLNDPAGTLEPFVKQLATDQARQLVEQNLSSYRDQVFADQFVEQNSRWLHARDQGGNVVREPSSGKPYLSPAGRMFRDYVVALDRAGMKDLRQQQEHAMALVERDLLQQQFRQAQAVQQGQQQQRQVLAQNVSAAAGMHQPNLTGSFPPPPANPLASNAPPQNAALSLKDMLTQAFAMNGITDAAISEDLTRRAG